MTNHEYYFKRDQRALAFGEMIDELGKFEREIFRSLHIDGKSYEEIGSELDLDPDLIEEAEERVFEALKPIVELSMNKEFEADDVLGEVERDLVIDIFTTEIYFREDRANYIKTRRLSHVPA